MGNQENKLLPQEPKISHLVFCTALTLFDCSFYYYFFFSATVTPTSQGSSTVGMYYVCRSISRLHVDSYFLFAKAIRKVAKIWSKNLFFSPALFIPSESANTFRSTNLFLFFTLQCSYHHAITQVQQLMGRLQYVKLLVNNNKLMIARDWN